MAINLSDSIRVGQQKPVDDRYLNGLVPYSTITEAKGLIPVTQRYPGLTININGVEYWWHPGEADLENDPIIKTVDLSDKVSKSGDTMTGLLKTMAHIQLSDTSVIKFGNGNKAPIVNETRSINSIPWQTYIGGLVQSDNYIYGNARSAVFKYNKGTDIYTEIAIPGWPGSILNKVTDNSDIVIQSNFDIKNITQAGAISTIHIFVQKSNSYGQFIDGITDVNWTALGNDGYIYVLENQRHRLSKWLPGSSQGEVVAGDYDGQSASVASDLSHLSYPARFVIASNGDLYITDPSLHRIMKWVPGQTSGELFFGGNGSGSGVNQIGYPDAIKLDESKGIIYVASNADKLIYSIDLITKEKKLVSTGANIYLSSISDFEPTNEGKLYISTNNQVYFYGGTDTSFETEGIILSKNDKKLAIDGKNILTEDDIPAPVDISEKEDKSNKVTSLNTTNDITYPTSKAVGSALNSLQSLLSNNIETKVNRSGDTITGDLFIQAETPLLSIKANGGKALFITNDALQIPGSVSGRARISYDGDGTTSTTSELKLPTSSGTLALTSDFSGKANLNGGNSFSGDQTVDGYLFPKDSILFDANIAAGIGWQDNGEENMGFRFDKVSNSFIFSRYVNNIRQPNPLAIDRMTGIANFSTMPRVNGVSLVSTEDISSILDQKGQPNGFASLDSGGRVPVNQLPDSIVGGLKYGGTYNGTIIAASDTYPELEGQSLPSSGYLGVYFIATANFNIAGTDYFTGDWVLSNGDGTYQRIPNADAVTSVFGRLGNVVANESDYQSFYPRLSQSYNDPSWINQLAWSKITGAPNTLAGYGVTLADPYLLSKANLTGGNTFTNNQIINGHVILGDNYNLVTKNGQGAQVELGYQGLNLYVGGKTAYYGSDKLKVVDTWGETTLMRVSTSSDNSIIQLPNTSGKLALTSDIPNVSNKANSNGSNATGIWPIDISGSAGSATHWGGRQADLNSIQTPVGLISTGVDGIARLSFLGETRSWLGLGSAAYQPEDNFIRNLYDHIGNEVIYSADDYWAKGGLMTFGYGLNSNLPVNGPLLSVGSGFAGGSYAMQFQGGYEYNNLWFRTRNGDRTTNQWNIWKRLLTQDDINPGGETLQSVTDRGNSTTKAIITSDKLSSFIGLNNSQLDFQAISNTYSEIQSSKSGVTYEHPLILQRQGGNVGIGTTNPLSKLHVAGAGRFDRGDGSSSANWISGIFGPTVDNNRVVIGNLKGVATIGGHTGNMSAWSNLSLNPDGGNVGIGTTNPAHKFVVSNNGREGFEVAVGSSPIREVVLQNYDREVSTYRSISYDASLHQFREGRLIVNKDNPNTDWSTSQLHIQGSNPSIAFHWPGIFGTSLKMLNNGVLSWEGYGLTVNGPVEAAAPTSNNQLATKKYVDDAVASGGGGAATGYFEPVITSWSGGMYFITLFSEAIYVKTGNVYTITGNFDLVFDQSFSGGSDGFAINLGSFLAPKEITRFFGTGGFSDLQGTDVPLFTSVYDSTSVILDSSILPYITAGDRVKVSYSIQVMTD